MVEVGDETLGPAAISILSGDYPPAMPATVTNIYSMSIAISG